MKKMRLSPSGRGPIRWHVLGITLALCTGIIVALGSLTNIKTEQIARAQNNDDAYESEVQKGTALLRRHQYEDALKSFKRANEMRDKKSAESLFGMAQAYQGLEAYKNVVESCGKVIEFAGGDARLQAEAYNLEGLALQSQSDGKDQKKLKDAEAAFRQGLTINVELSILHYNLGVVLMQESRDPEGVAELQKFIQLVPNAANANAVRKMIENPRRAREAYAPDFSVTTSDGEYIALDDLRGKVVLLDFWGTWCPPCVASVPTLRSLRKKYEKEPAFVMISVSSDSEDEKWRTFIAKNQMAWPQYLDRDHKIQRAFAVRAFPTYILIDHEGIIRFRSIGLSLERESNLEDAIRKQMKIAPRTAPSD